MEPTLKTYTVKQAQRLFGVSYPAARKRFVSAGIDPVETIGRSQLFNGKQVFAVDVKHVLRKCFYCPNPIGVGAETHWPHDEDCPQKSGAAGCYCNNFAHVECCEKAGCNG